MFKILFVSLFLFFAFAKTTQAQQKVSGTVIQDFGPTYTVPHPDIKTENIKVFKAVFDVAKSPEDPAEMNRYFETVARFLNLHENAAVSVEKLKPVLVVHGSAAFGLMNHAAYNEKYGVDNPNIPLLEALHNAGIPIILCGQTAGARDISLEKRWDKTQMALSAMTALIYYQNNDYRLIAF